MEKTVFQDPRVADELKRFVKVELYVDANDEKSQRDAELEVKLTESSSQPMYLLLNPDGTEIARQPGGSDAENFLAFLRKAR